MLGAGIFLLGRHEAAVAKLCATAGRSDFFFFSFAASSLTFRMASRRGGMSFS